MCFYTQRNRNYDNLLFFTRFVFLLPLSLQGVSAGTGGAVALAEALMKNQTLQTLE